MTTPDAAGAADAAAAGAPPHAPVPVPGGAPVPPQAAVRSPLSDGEWHRLHPLTPLLRGGLFLLVLLGIVVTNLRDRLITIFLPRTPGEPDYTDYEGDPIDFIVANNLILIAILVVLGVLIVLLAVFWTSWRFHTFRITGDDVEVRSGVLFRTHRRAPLDRVQGVNLTRPMIARLLGMAKLEVVGAGLDANVKLEYLSTSNAETIRGDILRLASGRQLAEAAAKTPGGMPLGRATAAAVSAGITGLIEGAEPVEAEPASVVHIPPGRLIASHLLSGSTIWLIVLVAAVIAGAIFGTPWVLFSIVPALIGFGTYWFRQITRSLRYSIAPTPAGVRITFGLFTTITETLPPGRVHAFEIRQPILWRRFGWWAIRVNRLSGRAATDTQAQQFADVLPVGTRDDVERVLRLFLPGVSPEQWSDLFTHGLLGPVRPGSGAEDPYTTTPRRARWLRPLSWRRNGFLLTPEALLLRSGVLRRALVILPLARLQSLRIGQGPVDRAAGVAGIVGHTVLGPVSGSLGILDRDAVYRLWQDGAAAVIAAAAGDRSHRWDEAEQVPPSDADAADARDAGDAADAGDAGPGTVSDPAGISPAVVPGEEGAS